MQVKIHEKIHTRGKPYKCEICGKTSSGLSNVNVYIMTHTKKTHMKKNHHRILFRFINMLYAVEDS